MTEKIEPNVFCAFSEMRKTDSVVEHPKNPNRHGERQVEKLARVIELNGWRSPIVISKRSGFVIKGHGRLLAAKLRGWKVVPIELQDYTNESEEYADMIADNEIARMAKMDADAMNDILCACGPDCNIDAFGIDAEDLSACADEELEEEKQKKKSKCPKCGFEF